MVNVVPDDLRWNPDITRRAVDFRRIEDIAFTPMSTSLRNDLITRTYGDLAEAMASLFGTGDATWAGFGQWASSTIGGYLNLPIPGFGFMIGRAFGDGNRDVFADIGRAHTTFLATVGAAHAAGDDLDEAWEACDEELRRRLMKPPGGPAGGNEAEFWASAFDPRLRPEGPNHNLLLRLGFRAYLRALQASDPEQRSEHILLGNCLIGLHEQRLLSLAISVGFRSWLRTITTPWRVMQTRHDWRNKNPGRWRLRVEHGWIRFATKFLIGVALPDGTVKTGKAVPTGERPLPVTPVPFPDSETQKRRRIQDLSDETILGLLFTAVNANGRPARCWNSLRDRMAYIVALFAQHQRSDFWFDDEGRVVRPDPADDFEEELAEQLARMDEAPRDDTTPPRPCHLSDEDLDRFRSLPTHVPLDDPETIDFSSVAEESVRDRLRPIAKAVAERYEQITEPGQHLDPATCLQARSTFEEWRTLWFMGLLFRSLPDSYGGAAGVHVLGQVSNLATDPFRRSGETAHFVVDLLDLEQGWDRGQLEPRGAAYRSVLGVRAMHSIITYQLLRDGWDTEAHGLPLNQEDVLGAALAFGVSAVEMLDDLEADLDDEIRNRYVRFWLGIGFLLGAPYEAITIEGPSGPVPLDFEQAQAVAAAIRRRHRARSLDGVRLTEALIEGIADGFPRSFGWISSGLMKVLGDDEVNSVLMVISQRGRRRSAMVAALFQFMLGHRLIRPLARAMIGAIGRVWVWPFLEQGHSRPYRRPRQSTDDRRIERADRAADYWPINCGAATRMKPLTKGLRSRR